MKQLWLMAAVLSCLGMASTSDVYRGGGSDNTSIFFTPESVDVPQVLEAIASARSSFHMEMYHLTDAKIIDELISAHERGVDVQVVLDAGNADKEKANGAYHRLSEAGIKVMKSSKAFSLTHTKSFVVDGETSYIMSINLTSIVPKTRDAGYITHDPSIAQFLESLIQTDMDNAQSQGMAAPSSIPSNIVLSPVNSRDRIVALINSATESIQLSVENLSDPTIINALTSAASRGVKVEALMPRCDLSSNDFDMPAAKQLDAAGVAIHMMPAPMSAEQPYIHQKSIVVDNQRAFLGSVNFSYNSLDKGREVGIIFNDPSITAQMTQVYNLDASVSLSYNEAASYQCPKSPWDENGDNN